MAKKKYLDVKEKLRDLDTDFFHDSIVKLKAELQGLQDDYPDHENLYISVDRYYESIDVELYGTRKETDKERDKRLDKARKIREKNAAHAVELEENERAELKRLQEKYNADSSYK